VLAFLFLRKADSFEERRIAEKYGGFALCLPHRKLACWQPLRADLQSKHFLLDVSSTEMPIQAIIDLMNPLISVFLKVYLAPIA
jgi:hypothetical protein